jgi:MoaA/NifB/PqqE/SkfB family radical SAM enzyme
MFEYRDLKDLHLEITSRCQASCPMCLRNYHGGQENNLLQLHDWSLNDFKKRISVDLLKQLGGFYFCGNLGDPIINNDLTKIIEYAVSLNPNLYIRVHTNGGARDTAWWKNLATVLPSRHLVIFSLDGLSDTHSIYRIGTKFETVFSNALTFISAGGKAEWSFIKFKHNEHQIDQARKLAEAHGFLSFTVKNTSRFLRDPTFDILDKNNNIVFQLKTPTDMHSPIITQDIIDNYKIIVEEAEINCPIKQEKQIFIDCRGIIYPCCWIASLPWTELREGSPANEVKKEMVNQYRSLVEMFGSERYLSTDHFSIAEIFESNAWKSIEDFMWQKNKFIMCARTCGNTKRSFIKATEQKIEGQQFV